MTKQAQPTGLSRGHGVSVWRQIADALAGEISCGALRSGAQLPTEEALSSRFGVNRHTVRRALAALSEQGLVRAARGSGTFVAGGPLTYPIGARTRFSEIVARSGRDPGGRLLGAREEAASAEAAAALALPPGAPVLVLDTVRSADGVPVSVAHSALPLPRFAGLDGALLSGVTFSDALERYGAGDYRRAWTRIRARPAAAREAQALGLAGGLVLEVESLNVDGAGAPVQVTRSAFAAERVEFLIES